HLDCVILEDTRTMGQRAIEWIQARRLGQPAPSVVSLDPKLVTKENVNSEEVRAMVVQDWTLGHRRWSTSQ
ncbi:MAG: hypothetical protein WBX18_18245, partial [Terracidiphilus sp.]